LKLYGPFTDWLLVGILDQLKGRKFPPLIELHAFYLYMLSVIL